jgi:hypothetical protein
MVVAIGIILLLATIVIGAQMTRVVVMAVYFWDGVADIVHIGILMKNRLQSSRNHMVGLNDIF